MSTNSGRRLLGHDDELRCLFGHLDGGGTGGRAIGLLGEPGVGRSALLAEAVEHAPSLGFTVLTARGSRSETPLPFAGLHQVLRPCCTAPAV
ncbi:hypothetical protein [Dactylosporangium sp. NPDC000521]|uniref:hypothetical protein n=1 Tax=Dactylosporangium sp. NPDC000521 TaxID=3363975 RepID=UPI0036AA4467